MSLTPNAIDCLYKQHDTVFEKQASWAELGNVLEMQIPRPHHNSNELETLEVVPAMVV